MGAARAAPCSLDTLYTGGVSGNRRVARNFSAAGEQAEREDFIVMCSTQLNSTQVSPCV